MIQTDLPAPEQRKYVGPDGLPTVGPATWPPLAYTPLHSIFAPHSGTTDHNHCRHTTTIPLAYTPLQIFVPHSGTTNQWMSLMFVRSIIGMGL